MEGFHGTINAKKEPLFLRVCLSIYAYFIFSMIIIFKLFNISSLFFKYILASWKYS